MRLRLSPELALPLEAVTEVFGLLGARGSGKTTAARRLVDVVGRGEVRASEELFS